MQAMGEHETRFGYIYATFTTRGQRPHEALVTVCIDDATRTPHTWGSFGVVVADETREGLNVALTAATDAMARSYGVCGMTWVPQYDGSFKGCQWHPETMRPVNGRVLPGSHHISTVRPDHGRRSR
jgi:hypothetical protein